MTWSKRRSLKFTRSSWHAIRVPRAPSRLQVIGLYCRRMFAGGDVAELADALDLGSSSREGVQVQLLSSPVPKGKAGVRKVTSFHTPLSNFPFCFDLAALLAEQRTINMTSF